MFSDVTTMRAMWYEDYLNHEGVQNEKSRGANGIAQHFAS